MPFSLTSPQYWNCESHHSIISSPIWAKRRRVSFISGEVMNPMFIQPDHMKRRQGKKLSNPSRALNWRGAHLRSMKSDGSKMNSSYSSADMYSPSMYW